MLRVHSVCCVVEPAILRSDSTTARQSGILLATSHLHHRRRHDHWHRHERRRHHPQHQHQQSSSPWRRR